MSYLEFFGETDAAPDYIKVYKWLEKFPDTIQTKRLYGPIVKHIGNQLMGIVFCEDCNIVIRSWEKTGRIRIDIPMWSALPIYPPLKEKVIASSLDLNIDPNSVWIQTL
jgi:hypothetical protein